VLVIVAKALQEARDIDASMACSLLFYLQKMDKETSAAKLVLVAVAALLSQPSGGVVAGSSLASAVHGACRYLRL
jgi:hypothetical protein